MKRRPGTTEGRRMEGWSRAEEDGGKRDGGEKTEGAESRGMEVRGTEG